MPTEEDMHDQGGQIDPERGPSEGDPARPAKGRAGRSRRRPTRASRRVVLGLAAVVLLAGLVAVPATFRAQLDHARVHAETAEELTGRARRAEVAAIEGRDNTGRLVAEATVEAGRADDVVGASRARLAAADMTEQSMQKAIAANKAKLAAEVRTRDATRAAIARLIAERNGLRACLLETNRVLNRFAESSTRVAPAAGCGSAGHPG